MCNLQKNKSLSFLKKSFSPKTFLEDIEVHRKIGEEMFETLLKNYMQVWQNLS